MPELNPCPYISHFACGFCFHITFDEAKKLGKDQWGGQWKNVAENKNSMIPEPINPEYLNIFLDAFNALQSFKPNEDNPEYHIKKHMG